MKQSSKKRSKRNGLTIAELHGYGANEGVRRANQCTTLSGSTLGMSTVHNQTAEERLHCAMPGSTAHGQYEEAASNVLSCRHSMISVSTCVPAHEGRGAK